jgi:hypothetical protein
MAGFVALKSLEVVALAIATAGKKDRVTQTLLTPSVCHHMCLFDIHLASHFYCCTKSLYEFINKQTVNAGCCFNVKLEFRLTLGIETTNELIVYTYPIKVLIWLFVL